MASHPLQDFIRRLRRARSVTEGGHLTDAQLLERFAKQRDEAAFEVLVWRHGTLVLNVAGRLLRHAADAEDVFQATFLTLARKAAAIRRGTSVGSWLYKVAYRLALRARRTAARRERQQNSDLDNVAAPAERGDAELAAVLAEEVNRLPERCRAVVVLCYLQGATTEAAARVLGCPRGTVLSRLASARQRLRQRLIRRGLAPAAALAAVSFGEAASAGPSAALVAGVVAASLPFAAGGAVVPMVSPHAAALAQGALQKMMWNKIKIVTMMACMLALVGTGSGWLARSRRAAEASLTAAETPVKKERLVEAAPERAEKIRKEIAEIREEMVSLAQREQQGEVDFGKAAMEARLRLLELQDDLKWREEQYQFEREKLRDRLKRLQSQIPEEEKVIDAFEQKTPGTPYPALIKAKERRRELQKQCEALQNQEQRLFAIFRKLKADTRKQMMEAEEELRLIEARQARQREDFAAQRERMQARLQRLENKDLDLEPADRLRAVERKLDALRRDVGELRRALERQEKTPQRKP
jgi:RNA polymerase sigma factor (sigma-70 family)